jgi:predicted O-methyltransferase YrrM
METSLSRRKRYFLFFNSGFKEKSLSKAGKVLKNIEKMTEKTFLPIVGPNKGRILVGIIREYKPRRVLEIGTLIGYSAVLMAKELESNAHLITIGIRSDEAKMARENIKRAEVPSTVEVIVGDAIEVIPTLKGRFDMVFIDADKTEYLEYLRLVESKIQKGCVIVADNVGVFANEMKDYLHYVRASGKYSSRYVPVGEDGLEVSVKL